MIKLNSKEIEPGDTFICLPTGQPYEKEALERGASEIKHMTRTELGNFADAYFDHPSQKLTVVGVTGTNGKTTVTHLVAQALNTLGYTTKVQGTLSGKLTTPESLDTHKSMKDHLDQGGTHFIMEVSSHAIDQNRIAGIQFKVKCLTNITQDHLDYHKTFPAYKTTKLGWMASANGKAIYPENYLSEPIFFKNPLLGKFNEENIKAAIAILKTLGLTPDEIKKGLESATPPPGRFETIRTPNSCLVIVDYAHTPDGLEKILIEGKTIAQTQNGTLWTLFGCGGDRDRGKRPIMAKIANDYSDHIIITQDNPRNESPTQILDDILKGLPDKHRAQIIADRKEAIRTAIHKAKPNDVVIIAGKGHETYQIIGETRVEFDDRKEAKDALLENLS